jgi:Sec7-like guanine-nucleotide exchange factor
VADSTKFLHQHLGYISKDALGKFFGAPEEQSVETFRSFISEIDFQGLEIDDGLRMLLLHFSLPGEAQQIERIVNGFSEEFLKQNPDRLCIDSIYLLVYSLMMLQTDAHNPNVLKKMTLEGFLGVTKHIKVKNATPLDPEFLSGLYYSVLEYPLSVHFKIKKQSDL